jgi:hypothetical protein
MHGPTQRSALPSGLAACLAGGLLLAAGHAAAAEPSVPPQDNVPLEDRPIESPTVLDAQHGRVSGMIEELLTRTDALFSGDRLYDAPTGSYVQLGARGTLWPERYASSDIAAITRVKVNLPRMQERLKLVFDRDLEDVTKPPVQRDAEVAAGVTAAENNPYVGLRALAVDRMKLRLTTDGGLKLRGSELDPFARGRLTRVFEWNGWTIPLSETVLWRRIDGLSATTDVAFLYPLNKRTALAFQGNATWQETQPGFIIGHNATLVWRVDERSLMGIEAVVIGQTKPQREVVAYSAALRYRRLIYGDWLVMEIRPQVVFPSNQDYKTTAGVTLVLEAFFGSNYLGAALR